MLVIDKMPAELRGCVHEFGFGIVAACLNAGVSDPRAIRVLVKEIWQGARECGQRQGAVGTIDWLLIQNEAKISAATLFRIFAENNIAIIKAEPSRAMLDASMATVSKFDLRITKEEKHRRRLRAAIRASMLENQFNLMNRPLRQAQGAEA